MRRTAGLHPHAEGLKKVTGAEETHRDPGPQGRSVVRRMTGNLGKEKELPPSGVRTWCRASGQQRRARGR